MMQHVSQVLACWILLLGTSLSIGHAQDDTSAETSAPETSTTDAAQTESATAQAPEAPETTLAQLKQEWADRLAVARSKYEVVELAGASPPAGAVAEYREALDQLNALIPQMIDAGLAEYAASDPPSDALAKELLGIAINEANRRNDAAVLKITQGLTEHGCPRSLIEQAAQAKRLGLFQKEVFDEALQRYDEYQADDLPRVKIVTDKGEIVLELFEDQAPNTVANFISLVQKGFYDGLTFHRVLEDFVAQGGDPSGNGSGGPGYTIACECYEPDHRNHFPGVLAMAHAGRDTGGSQFYITLSDFDRMKHTTTLDGKHTVFGRVISGMDVVDALQKRDPRSPQAPEPDKMLDVEVIRLRDHAYEPEVQNREEPQPTDGGEANNGDQKDESSESKDSGQEAAGDDQ